MKRYIMVFLSATLTSFAADNDSMFDGLCALADHQIANGLNSALLYSELEDIKVSGTVYDLCNKAYDEGCKKILDSDPGTWQKFLVYFTPLLQEDFLGGANRNIKKEDQNNLILKAKDAYRVAESLSKLPDKHAIVEAWKKERVLYSDALKSLAEKDLPEAFVMSGSIDQLILLNNGKIFEPAKKTELEAIIFTVAAAEMFRCQQMGDELFKKSHR